MVIDPSEANPRNSEGAIVQLADGSLFLAYSRFTSGADDNSEAQIACRVSKDGGRTWSDDRILVDREGRENVMSVSIQGLPSGELLLFYGVKNGWDDLRFYVRRSSDEMRTLSGRVCATPHEGYHVVNNDRIVRLFSGRLIVPAAFHPCAEGTFETWSHRGIAMCFLSDDDGRTWRRSCTQLEGPSESGSGLQEPGVIERGDGRLMMWARTDMGFQYESSSEDGGETWSPALPGPLVSPCSAASIKRMPWDGRLLVVFNDHSGKHPFREQRRTPLCTAVSYDEGRTWTNSKVLEGDPDGWYCYTSVTFVDDRVVLGYCAGDTKIGGLNRLKVVAVQRDWLCA